MTQQTSKRRTARISTPKPYEPVALFRVYDKQGTCLGYAAPSRDGSKTYQVTCDDHGHWHCTCPATVENCCHVKAAQELCAIRVQRGQPGCFQGKATAGVETEEHQEAQSAYDLVADLIDPQLPEPAQSPEELAAAAREELAQLEAQLLAVHAKEIQASREAAGRDAIASDVITNGSIDHAQERVEAAKQAEARRENAPLNGSSQGFSLMRRAS